MSTDDHELIRDYTRRHSQAAFAELVRRYVNLVYSAARRQVPSHHFAEEVTQTVFVALARNAGKLQPGTPLAAWLYLVTRRTAIDLNRREGRRQAREQTALEIAEMKSTPPVWRQLESSLDDAMASLDQSDSTALLLRYFENKSLREVGHALGVSEDAAQKRISRALELLRVRFARRGIAVTAVGLATDLSAHAIEAAPNALGAAIASAAAAGGLTHAAVQTATLTMTTLQKAFLATGVALAVGGALFEANAARSHRAELDGIERQNDVLAARVRQAEQQNGIGLRRLDEAQQKLAEVRAGGPSGSAADAAVESEMRSWLARLNRLKELFAQMPEKAIPEMRLLSEQIWFEAVQNADLDDDSWGSRGRQDTMMGMRNRAKVRFCFGLMDALRSYVKAHEGQLPADATDLLPHFKDNAWVKASQVEPDMLRRYAVVYSGAFDDVPADERNAILVEITSGDEEHDQRISIGPNGSGWGYFHDLTPDTRHALRAFAAANAGATPSNPSQLLPYFNPPLSAARQSKFLLNADSLLPH